MAHFDDIYELAADNYGLITSAEAKNLGVAKSELNRWVGMGRLLKRGQGVYKLVRYVPTEYDRYAEAVALVGDGSFLFGEAVLAMHGLALANPRHISVGTTKRVRRELPEWVQPVTVSGRTVTSYEGIPSQSLAEAILECRGIVMGNFPLGFTLPKRISAIAFPPIDPGSQASITAGIFSAIHLVARGRPFIRMTIVGTPVL